MGWGRQQRQTPPPRWMPPAATSPLGRCRRAIPPVVDVSMTGKILFRRSARCLRLGWPKALSAAQNKLMSRLLAVNDPVTTIFFGAVGSKGSTNAMSSAAFAHQRCDQQQASTTTSRRATPGVWRPLAEQLLRARVRRAAASRRRRRRCHRIFPRCRTGFVLS